MRYGKTALLSKKSRKSEGNARKVEGISFTLVQRCVNMTKAISYGNCIRTRSSGDRVAHSECEGREFESRRAHQYGIHGRTRYCTRLIFIFREIAEMR